MDLILEMKKRLLRSDGGMGTLLQSAGLQTGETPEDWNLEHGDVVVGLHRAYLDAGCDMVTSNSFGATPVKYHGKHQLEQVLAAALANARTAVEQAGHGWVALDVGPTGRVLGSYGDYTFDQAVDSFKQQILMGLAGKPDLILIETMSDSLEAKAAVLAARECTDLPVVCTCAFGKNGHLLTGATPEVASLLLQGLGASGVGMNCGLGPDQMLELTARFQPWVHTSLWVVPNAGLPRIEPEGVYYDVTPRQFGRALYQIAKQGASVVGGCCGTTPEHLSCVYEATRDLPAPELPAPASAQLLCSRKEVVEFTASTAVAELERDAANLPSACRRLLKAGAQVVAVTPAQARVLDASPLALPLLLRADDLEELELTLRPFHGCPAVSWQGAAPRAQVESLCHKYGALLV